jgi:hypothetical protein
MLWTAPRTEQNGGKRESLGAHAIIVGTIEKGPIIDSPDGGAGKDRRLRQNAFSHVDFSDDSC